MHCIFQRFKWFYAEIIIFEKKKNRLWDVFFLLLLSTGTNILYNNSISIYTMYMPFDWDFGNIARKY